MPQMNGADRKGHLLHAVTRLAIALSFVLITETTKSANFPAASGLPMWAAHCGVLQCRTGRQQVGERCESNFAVNPSC